MSKFEAELRLPCKQPYAYISVWIRGETAAELSKNLDDFYTAKLTDELTQVHTGAYDVVMGVKPKAEQDPRDLIVSELGAKVISEEAAPQAAAPGKPWERKKPAPKAGAKTDSNDPFAGFN